MGACLKPEVPSDNGEMRGSRKGSRKGSRNGKKRRSGGRKTREGSRQRAHSQGSYAERVEQGMQPQGGPQQGPPQQGPPPNQPAQPKVEDPNAKGQAEEAPERKSQPMHTKYGGQGPNGQNGYVQQPFPNGPPQGYNGQQPPCDNGQSPMMRAQQPPPNGQSAQQPPAEQPPAEAEAPANAESEAPVRKTSPMLKGLSPKHRGLSAEEATQQWDPSEAVLTIDDPAHAHEVHYGKPVEVVTQPAAVSSRYSFDPPAHYQVTTEVPVNAVNQVSTYVVDEDVTEWELQNGVTDM